MLQNKVSELNAADSAIKLVDELVDSDILPEIFKLNLLEELKKIPDFTWPDISTRIQPSLPGK